MRWIPVFMALGLLVINSDHVAAFDPCQDGATHKPRSDVEHKGNADYGRKVEIAPPTTIPLTVDMVERDGVDMPEGTSLEAVLGLIEIDENGNVLYEGEDVLSGTKKGCKQNGSTGTDETKQ